MNPRGDALDLSLRRSHDLGAAAAAHRRARAEGHRRSSSTTSSRSTSTTPTTTSGTTARRASATSSTTRPAVSSRADRSRPTTARIRDLARDGFFGMRDPAAHHRHRDGPRDRSRADLLGEDVLAATTCARPRRGRGDITADSDLRARSARRRCETVRAAACCSRSSSCSDRAGMGRRVCGAGSSARASRSRCAVRLLGLVFWFLAIISPLPYVRWNETCLVLLPDRLLMLCGSCHPAPLEYARGRVVMLGSSRALHARRRAEAADLAGDAVAARAGARRRILAQGNAEVTC